MKHLKPELARRVGQVLAQRPPQRLGARDAARARAVLAFGVFYATLAASVVLYRISPLHPLAKYPGPFLLKVTKFAAMYHALDGKQYVFFKSLHDKYGPFVRVGEYAPLLL